MKTERKRNVRPSVEVHQRLSVAPEHVGLQAAELPDAGTNDNVKVQACSENNLSVR